MAALKTVKQETKADIYLEKLVSIRSGENQNINRGVIEDVTANQKCKIKVRAVGLDFEVAKWLEK